MSNVGCKISQSRIKAEDSYADFLLVAVNFGRLSLMTAEPPAGHSGTADRAAARPLPRLSPRENIAGVLAMRRDQLTFLEQVVRDHGDIVRFRLGGLPAVMLNHPDHLHHVFVTNHDNY